MGYNHRNDEIRDNVTRMRSDWEAQRDALATPPLQCAALGQRLFVVLAQDRRCAHFKASLVGHQLRHFWVDLDLRVKPRDPEASIRVALRDVRCPRCNGYGKPRIIALARHPSI
jgi:hypothetical protein